MDPKKKCAHPSCSCDAQADSDYCSTYCEGQAETPDVICSCGHGSCGATPSQKI
jgi:hypothetical protein